jgi:hypothetical protein
VPSPPASSRVWQGSDRYGRVRDCGGHHFPFQLCTVPVPKPVKRATLPMPSPLESSCRAPCYLRRFVSWPAKTSAHDSTLGRKVPVAFDLGLDGAQASVDPLLDHAALEFRKGTRHVEEQLASGCCGVKVLLIKIQITPTASRSWMVRSRSISERPSRTTAQATRISNFLRPASLSMASRPGR